MENVMMIPKTCFLPRAFISSGITEASALEFLSSKVERIVNPDSGPCGAMS